MNELIISPICNKEFIKKRYNSKYCSEECAAEVRGECWGCKEDVMMDERYSKQQGKLFHKNCYNVTKSNAKGMGIGG